jgi:hypothetical protein
MAQLWVVHKGCFCCCLGTCSVALVRTNLYHLFTRQCAGTRHTERGYSHSVFGRMGERLERVGFGVLAASSPLGRLHFLRVTVRTSQRPMSHHPKNSTSRRPAWKCASMSACRCVGVRVTAYHPCQHTSV